MSAINSTIFALATPPGRSGLAVVRASGPQAEAILSALTHNKTFQPRRASLAKLYAKGEKQPFDNALVIWFKSPKSFTGEDVFELHLHGGPAVIEAATQALLEFGATPAGPGAFTRRGFEHNKLDLVQAEAIADLIDAQTQGQLLQAQRQLRGDLGDLYQTWREALSSIRAQIEACIDFPEEDDVINDALEALGPKISALNGQLEKHLQDGKRGERIREGLSIALIGPVNAGKSTLLNRLAGEEAAIVSDMPGTTRDIVRVQLNLGGFLVQLADTAGLRSTSQAIEKEGIKRSKAAALNADIRIFVLDVTSPEQIVGDMKGLAQAHDFIVFNKSDVLQGDLPALGLGGLPPMQKLSLSARLGDGVDALLLALQARVVEMLGAQENPSFTRARHRRAIEETHNALGQAITMLSHSPELAGEHLREAGSALGQITGEAGVEEILGKIFSTFCIGK